MRKCLLLLFAFTTTFAVGQDSTQTSLVIKVVPPEGFLLDKGWTLYAGDSPHSSIDSTNDSHSTTIDPTKDIVEIKEMQQYSRGWMRLRFSVDTSYVKEPLVIHIEQSIASEVYLNGHRLYSFGQIGQTPADVNAHNPLGQPFALPVEGDTVQELAVRFALPHNPFYFKFAGAPNPFFIATINTVSQSLSNIAASQWPVDPNAIDVGLFLLMFITHLVLYRSYPRQRANLFFSLFAFLSAVYLLISKWVFPEKDVAIHMHGLLLIVALWHSSYLLFLKAIYTLTKSEKRRVFNALLLVTVVSFLLACYVYEWGWIPAFLIVPNLISIEMVRVSLLAARRKQRASVVLVVGAVCFVTFFLCYNLLSHVLPPGWGPAILGDIAWHLMTVSLPVSTSIFLALEFTFVSRSLEEKLRDVEQLSERTVAQEKEKQQILASQKGMLEEQVTERTAQLKLSLEELKATQSQLVQREKMASLGELTAGIAHEIQNPLNFVNNFTDVNKELLNEAKQELSSGHYKEAETILGDIEANGEKIAHHGRRADSIVKSMLQHARRSTGEKRPTDINKLADEYLRLSYQGMRAKDNNFNALIETNFENNIGEANVVAQDIGRVLLNLYNNAFYAVQEKKAKLNGQYEPVVSVSTRRQGDHINITVKDNGTGMPQNVTNKIFQPFFTTKPTGEGTGLGLSLSYDIVTKGHGGEINVQSKEGEGSTFVVNIPAT